MSPLPANSDPLTSNPVATIPCRWVCNTPGIKSADWPGSVITWPSSSAYECNNRTGQFSRTVYARDTGELLFPYMGPWANGARVTVVTGEALIIEWKRGSDLWRETLLKPGQSHTIALLPHEDGAMIEGPDHGCLLSLEGFTPQKFR